MNLQAENPLLVLNAGSSSLKFALFDAHGALERRLAGSVDRIGSENASLIFTIPRPNRAQISAPNHVAALESLLKRISETVGAPRFAAVGHRIVHGGALYRQPQRVDDA